MTATAPLDPRRYGLTSWRIELGPDTSVTFTGPGAERLAREYATAAAEYASLAHDGFHVCTQGEWSRLSENTLRLERQIASEQAALATASEQMLDAGLVLEPPPECGHRPGGLACACAAVPRRRECAQIMEELLDRVRALDGRINQLDARVDMLARPQASTPTS
jgi:hypothetical protein